MNKRLWLLIVTTTDGKSVLFSQAETARDVAGHAAEACYVYGERNIEGVSIVPADAADVVKLAQGSKATPAGRARRPAA